MSVRFILASSSPSRLDTLRRAGIIPTVHAPSVDESTVSEPTTVLTVSALARLKGTSVLAELPLEDAVVVACDSLLDVDGTPIGKPGTPPEAASVWRRLRGRSGVLWTGHHVSVIRDGQVHSSERAVGTTVWFAPVTDAEIDAYVATGEPLPAAGAFTIDGYGAPFIERIEGDHHNVIGISLPTLRTLLAAQGVSWPSLWQV